MSTPITRRSFIKSAVVGAAGITVANVMSSCAPKQEGQAAATPEATDSSPKIQKADKTIDTDVLVVGIGTTGIMAAAAAADKGKKVIAVDTVNGLMAGNCVNTTAIWAVESTPEKQIAGYITQKEAFLHILQGTNYQSNGEVLRNLIANGGRAVDFLIDNGLPFEYIFAAPGGFDPSDFMNRGGHAYKTYGKDRAAVYQKILDDRKVTCMWQTTAKALITEGNKITGVQCSGADGKLIDIKAKAVILCTGGFMANMDMVTRVFAGSRVMALGSKACQGDGINMAQAAGAQLGKNFSISLNEFGGANEKGSSKFAYIPGVMKFNSIFQLPILGSVLVDNQGNRFMDEGKMCEATMFTSEPALRLGKYYLIVDQAYLKKISTTPVLDMVPAANKMVPLLQMALKGKVLTEIFTDFDLAIKEGWGFKADTLEALASTMKMDHLVETLKTYNQSAKSKADDLFYTDEKYLTAMETGPFYMAEFQPSSWCSLGGIKTDGNCHALNAQNQIIPGLFVAGTDADLWTVPYFQGGSAQGFCVTSGLIAGEAAAETAA
jgi:fumarate reductase flavoprotein subunit